MNKCVFSCRWEWSLVLIVFAARGVSEPDVQLGCAFKSCINGVCFKQVSKKKKRKHCQCSLGGKKFAAIESLHASWSHVQKMKWLDFFQKIFFFNVFQQFLTTGKLFILLNPILWAERLQLILNPWPLFLERHRCKTKNRFWLKKKKQQKKFLFIWERDREGRKHTGCPHWNEPTFKPYKNFCE